MASHADNHDRDKLVRWHQDLSSGPADGFPAYAVFLVSPEDRASHDVFRTYRSSFEERGAAYQHLVIFGQHGISSTLRGLLAQFGLTQEALPLLALFSDPPAKIVHSLPLSGSSPPDGPSETPSIPVVDTPNEPWRKVLKRLEDAVDRRDSALDLMSLDEVTGRHENGPVLERVGRVLREVS